MRVAVVSCVYPPEPVVSSRTSADVARALVERGHSVDVIAPFPSRPDPAVYERRRRVLFSIERGAPRVIRCFAFTSRSSRLLSRFLENASFGISSALVLAFVRKPDVIYLNTWPIVASTLLQCAARWRRIPVVTSVQDLYPDSLVSQRRTAKSSLLVRLVRRFDTAVARRSARLIVISERFAETYRSTRGIAAGRIEVIPNWADEDVCIDGERGRRFRARYRIAPDERLFVYAGNIGVAAGIDVILDAVRSVSADIRVLVAGSGADTDRIRSLSRPLGGRVLVHSPWPVEETDDVLSAADVFLLPTRGEQSFASVPSKLIRYFLAARPVLATALPGSDLDCAVRDARAGWVVLPDRPDLLAPAMEEVRSMPIEELAQTGRRAREYALAEYSRDACIPRVVKTVLEAANYP